MATQKRVVELHPRKGILNIDVISFERLAYRVFEEDVYKRQMQVLLRLRNVLILKLWNLISLLHLLRKMQSTLL